MDLELLVILVLHARILGEHEERKLVVRGQP